MSFYKTLSKYYNEIFSAEKSDLIFINSLLSTNDKILDLGCGTGNKTIFLKTATRKITAIDNDEEMIAEAKKNYESENINFLAQDMNEIDKNFVPQSFNTLLCLGNTLVHINDLNSFFKKSYILLKENGKFILQILNYNKIIKNEINTLPLIETENIIFKRFYNWPKNNAPEKELVFTAEITLKKENKVFKNSVTLYPILKEELFKTLKDANFKNINFYGSYQGEDFNIENSFALLASAEK